MLIGTASATVRRSQLTACTPPKPLRLAVRRPPSRPTSTDFYDADGKFLVDKAKDAYFDMFRRFQYPISDKLRKRCGSWTSACKILRKWAWPASSG